MFDSTPEKTGPHFQNPSDSSNSIEDETPELRAIWRKQARGEPITAADKAHLNEYQRSRRHLRKAVCHESDEELGRNLRAAETAGQSFSAYARGCMQRDQEGGKVSAERFEEVLQQRDAAQASEAALQKQIGRAQSKIEELEDLVKRQHDQVLDLVDRIPITNRRKNK